MEQTKVSYGEVWLVDGDSSVVVAPRRGGMVTSFNVAGREVFAMDDASFADETKNVRGGIPLLFPSPGRLTEDVWAGGPMKQHGFARNHAFDVTDRGLDKVSLRLRSSDAKEASYPYPFELIMTYSVSGRTLRIEADIANTGNEPMPMGFGLHPYFAVAQDQKSSVRVPTRTTRVFDNRAKMERAFTGLDLDGEEVDLHFLDHGTSEASLLSPDLVVSLRASPEFSHWVVWTLAGKDFVCLEPWTCPPDMLRTGNRLIAIPPGQSHKLWVEIRVSLAPTPGSPFLLLRKPFAVSEPLIVSSELIVPADELRWTAVRGSGPGGQNVNKVSSKVELRFDVARTAKLDDECKQRLVALAGHKMDKEGVLLVVCQETRDQKKNLEGARSRLAELLRAALIRPIKRRKTKISKGAIQRRLTVKKLVSEKKRARKIPEG